MEQDHGVPGSRGGTSCDSFHEYTPGPDRFCNCCRPSPERAKPAEAWWESQGNQVPERATEEWRTMLEAWVKAGAPGKLPKERKKA